MSLTAAHHFRVSFVCRLLWTVCRDDFRRLLQAKLQHVVGASIPGYLRVHFEGSGASLHVSMVTLACSQPALVASMSNTARMPTLPTHVYLIGLFWLFHHDCNMAICNVNLLESTYVWKYCNDLGSGSTPLQSKQLTMTQSKDAYMLIALRCAWPAG